MDVWRSDTFSDKSQVSALLIATTDHRAAERLTSGSLGDISWGSECQSTTVQMECATPPHVHTTSRYVTVSDRFSSALLLQATNTRAERPGYGAKPPMQSLKIIRVSFVPTHDL